MIFTTTYAYIRIDGEVDYNEQLKILSEQEYDTVLVGNCSINLFELMGTLVKKKDKVLISDISILDLEFIEFVRLFNELERHEIIIISHSDGFDSSKKYKINEIMFFCSKIISTTNNKRRKTWLVGEERGRPKISEEIVEKIKFMYFEEKCNMRIIAEECQVSLGTVHKYLNN